MIRVTETDFSKLGLQANLLANLASLGYEVMTPIQAQSLPTILAGRDVLGQAKTGSGKTVAFGLGLLNSLDATRFQIQALVLCPTRELAEQVATEIRRLARSTPNVKILTLCGGTPFRPQAESLKHGAHIIVGTPGRIGDHLERQTLALSSVAILVLDEADRMLEMGFEEAINAIVETLPSERQTLLFSATYPTQIRAIAKRFLRDPVTVKLESTHDNTTIEQHFYSVRDKTHRFKALRLLLHFHKPTSTLVFCNTKRETQAVADQLARLGFSVIALHGDLEQKDRDVALVRFSNHSVSILVATDVAARGLDILSLDGVINYEIAQDEEIHLHRIGRTGRAGAKGTAHSLYGDSERHKVAMFASDTDPITDPTALPPESCLDMPVSVPTMTTLRIDSGKKQKIRPGDILGVLTQSGELAGTDVGKINVADNWTYVAIKRSAVDRALKGLADGKLKGRSIRARRLQ
ncbi:MAG: ATP-independent RNA helicase DbpA [Gammaproteobacteria bacterium]|jgi:ATP-independent RNA helicase DbpA